MQTTLALTAETISHYAIVAPVLMLAAIIQQVGATGGRLNSILDCLSGDSAGCGLRR